MPDWQTGRVDLFDYERGTGLTGRRPFVDAPGSPDGLTVDAEGGVWVAMYDGRRGAPIQHGGRARRGRRAARRAAVSPVLLLADEDAPTLVSPPGRSADEKQHRCLELL
jgi:hypothetical protein